MKTFLKDIVNYIISNIVIIIFVLLSVSCVFYYKTECYCVIFKNVSYSIIAAFVFYIVIDYIPFARKKKIMRVLIDAQFSNLYEHIYHCVNGIISPFAFNPKKYTDKDDFTNDFYGIDLEENVEIFSSKNRKSYLESNKEHIKNIIEKLLDLHPYLSYKELDNISHIINSSFIKKPILPRKIDLPEEYIDSYPNNQKEIGESIYEIYELIKEIR